MDKLQHDVDLFTSGEGSAVERGLFAILHPHSEWNLTLVMEEPQIDTLLPPAPTAALNPANSANSVTSIPGDVVVFSICTCNTKYVQNMFFS